METDGVAEFRIHEEGKLTTPQAIAVVRGNTVVVERMPTAFRYYLLPIVLGLIGALYSSFGFVQGAIASTAGIATGFLIAIYLRNRGVERAAEAVADGERDVTSHLVVKKGKVVRLHREGEGSRTRLEVETPDHDFALIGDDEDVEKVYEALV